jgi:dTMP kinase
MGHKNLLVCFTGIDGSGKTTMSKELVRFLNEKGFRFKYVYARLNPFISRPLILIGRWIFLRKKDIFKDYSGYADMKRKAIKKHILLSKFYQKILLLDYFFQVVFKVKFPLVFGESIVCDRYVYDTIINDLLTEFNSKSDVVNLLNGCLYFFPKPDIIFLIDVPEEIALRRKNDVPSIEYLKERRKMYLEVGKEYKMKILDGTKDLKRLQEEIENEVLNKINRLRNERL